MDHSFSTLTPPDVPPRSPARFGGISRRMSLALTSMGLLAGGIAGGYIVGHAATSTATASPSPSTSSGSTSTGAFHSNEDPSHEAGESAQREAQENAGQVPTVP